MEVGGGAEDHLGGLRVGGEVEFGGGGDVARVGGAAHDDHLFQKGGQVPPLGEGNGHVGEGAEGHQSYLVGMGFGGGVEGVPGGGGVRRGQIRR